MGEMGCLGNKSKDELTVGREDELDVVLAFANEEGLLLRQDHLDVLLKRRVLKGIGDIWEEWGVTYGENGRVSE